MTDKATVFISCGIFQEELKHLTQKGLFSGEVEFLDAALHVDFDRLKDSLEAALQKARKSGAELKVLYGYCHPEMAEILEQFGAKKIDAGNCLEAIIGKGEIDQLNAEAKSFFLTAGWVNNYEKMFALGKEHMGVDFSNLFASYRRVVVFDTGIIPINEEKVRKFSAFTGLPVERIRITLDHFLELIRKM
jgi:hypothetical protein